MKTSTKEVAEKLGVSTRRVQQITEELDLTPEKVAQTAVYSSSEIKKIQARLADAQVPEIRRGFKVLTHDFRSPIQGGDPVFDGKYPFTTPKAVLDTGNAECAQGWNYCKDATTALRIAGLWPNGRPSIVVEVTAGSDAIERRNKRRASLLTFRRQLKEPDVQEVVLRLSQVFGEQQQAMTAEQVAWRHALSRPHRIKEAVETGLKIALQARGLNWQLKQYRAARDAWAARGALTVFYASKQNWIPDSATLLTDGIRDAYQNGLAIAIPTGVNELGWAMEE